MYYNKNILRTKCISYLSISRFHVFEDMLTFSKIYLQYYTKILNMYSTLNSKEISLY